jgi:hypothetical protein
MDHDATFATHPLCLGAMNAVVTGQFFTQKHAIIGGMSWTNNLLLQD